MFVERLHIDRFGILREQDVSGLSPGLCLFLGCNEAGKSTCLRFFQSMLFGYKRGNRSLDPMPEQRSRELSGGSLFLRTGDLGLLTLTRRPGAHGGTLSVSDESGDLLDEGILQRLLGGLTVDVFDNIFAFSLRNLMDLSSLKGDSVRHALHGAAFGLGLQSPAQVLKHLEDRMSVLLKRDSVTSSASLNKVLRELGEVREELRSRAPDMQVYTELQGRLETLEKKLDNVNAARRPLESSLRRVRRRLAVWRQWEETRRIREELLGLGAAPEDASGIAIEGRGMERRGDGGPTPSFAPDAVQRLDALLAQREERIAAEREADRACGQLRNDIAALAGAGRLAFLHPAVLGLREQKMRRRDEAGQLPLLERECAALRSQQQQALSRLGFNWNAERIADADTSVFSKDEVLRHAGALAEKESGLARAEQEYARLKAELSEGIGQEEAARGALQGISLPEQPLPEQADVENVTAALARARSALAELPRLRERAEKAGDEAARSLADIDPTWTGADLEAFDGSLGARQSLAGYAASIAETQSLLADARRSRRLAEEAAALAGNKAEAQEQRCLLYGDLPDGPTLEMRYGQLRKIERLSIELAAVRRDCEAAARAVHEYVVSSRKGGGKKFPPGVPYFLACALLFLAELGLAGAVLLRDSSLFLYAGAGLAALAFLACLMCCITLKPSRHESSEADEAALRYVFSLAESRRRRLAESLADLAVKASPWLGTSSPGEPGEGDIERALRLLESQGQKTALLERDRQELFTVRQAFASAHERLERAAAVERAAEEAAAEATEDWRGHLRSIKLSPSMQPEAVSGIFDRAATARACVAAAAEARQSLASASGSIADCLSLAGRIPFFAAFADQGDGLAEASNRREAYPSGRAGNGEPPWRRSLEEMEKRLAACRRYEAVRQEQRGLQSILQERMENRSRAEQRLTGAGESLEGARVALEAARASWKAWLKDFGFAETLSPQSAIEALEAMRAFLDREKEILAKEARRAAIVAGLEDFAREIALLAHSAGAPLPSGMRVEFVEPELTVAGQAGRQEADGRLRDGAEYNQERLGPEPADSFRFIPLEPAPALVPSALALLDSLSAKVEAAVNARNRLLEKEEQLAMRSQEHTRANTALEVTTEALSSLLGGAGASDAEYFRIAFARFQRIEGLREQERSLLAGMRGLASEEGGSVEELLASLERSSLDSLREEETLLSEELNTLEEEMRALSVERGQLIERRETLTGSEGRGPLLLREAVLLEELRRLSHQWSVLALAKDFLVTAKTRFEEEGQQGVIRFAGNLFSSITDGEYTGISASLEGDSFTAVHRSGDRRDPERQLSQGTREQLYLALRLAYIKNHTGKAEPLPVVMDDILVNFDPDRAANTARVLAEFATDCQLLFFTCHPGAADLLLKAAAGQKGSGPKPAAYTIKKGEIVPGV